MRKDEFRQRCIEIAYELLRSNHTTPLIYQKLREECKKEGRRMYNDIALSVICTEAMAKIKVQYVREKEDVVALHIARYDEIIENIEKQIEKIDMRDPDQFATGIKTNHLLIDALYHKERVLGIHKKSFRLELNNNVNIKKTTDKAKFDISLLPLEERIELLELINKAKRDENEVMGVIMRDEDDNKKVDYEEAEIISEEPNINKVKTLAKPTAIKKEEREVKTLTDVQQKMNETFLEQARRAFKKIDPSK